MVNVIRFRRPAPTGGPITGRHCQARPKNTRANSPETSQCGRIGTLRRGALPLRRIRCRPVPTCLLAFEPPDGGVAEHVLQLGLGLSAHGWEPRVAGPPQSSIDEALDEAGIPRVRLPLERGYGRPWRDAGALRGLLGLLRGGDVDLLHAHSAKAGALGRIAATATSTPSVYTPHAFAFLRPQPVTRVVAATLERALGAATGAIVCVAEQERRLALERRIARPDHLRVVRKG